MKTTHTRDVPRSRALVARFNSTRLLLVIGAAGVVGACGGSAPEPKSGADTVQGHAFERPRQRSCGNRPVPAELRFVR